MIYRSNKYSLRRTEKINNCMNAFSNSKIKTMPKNKTSIILAKVNELMKSAIRLISKEPHSKFMLNRLLSVND